MASPAPARSSETEVLESESLKRQHRRDVNCLEDSNRQCRVKALERLSRLFLNNVSSLSPESSRAQRASASSGCPQHAMFCDAKHRVKPVCGCRITPSSCSDQAEERTSYSREELRRFFLTDIYGPCLRLVADATSDSCREAAVNLLRTCIVSLFDEEETILFMSKHRPELGCGRRKDARNASRGTRSYGPALVDTVQSRLSGHPFCEPSEEIRGALLLLLIAILEKAQPRALNGLARDRGSADGCGSIWPEDNQEATNPYPLEGCDSPDVWMKAESNGEVACATETAKLERNDEAKRGLWQVEDTCLDGLTQCALKALADHDPHNKQLSCRLIVLLARCLLDTLTAALAGCLRHQQRKVRWHALDALQYLFAAAPISWNCMADLMTSLSSLVQTEAVPSIRCKICGCVGYWYRALPVRYLKPHMAKMLGALVTCVAAEDANVKSYGVRVLQCIAAPSLRQLKAAAAAAACHERKGPRSDASQTSRLQKRDTDCETDSDSDASDASGDTAVKEKPSSVAFASDRQLLEESWAAAAVDAQPDFGSRTDACKKWFKDRASHALQPEEMLGDEAREAAAHRLMLVAELLNHFAEETVAWVLSADSALWRFSPEPGRSQQSLRTLRVLLDLLPPAALVSQLPAVLAYLCKTCQHVDCCPFAQPHQNHESPPQPARGSSGLLGFLLSLAAGEAAGAGMQEAAQVKERHPGASRGRERTPASAEAKEGEESELEPQSIQLHPGAVVRGNVLDSELAGVPSAMKSYLEVMREVLACAEAVATLVLPPVWLRILSAQMQAEEMFGEPYAQAADERLASSVFARQTPAESQDKKSDRKSGRRGASAEAANSDARADAEVDLQRRGEAPDGGCHGRPKRAEAAVGGVSAVDHSSSLSKKSETSTSRLYPLILLGRMLATVDVPLRGARTRGWWTDGDASFCLDLIGEFVEPTGAHGRRPADSPAAAALADPVTFFGRGACSGACGLASSEAASAAPCEDAALPYAAVCVTSAVRACRNVCRRLWPRVITILLRLRVAANVPASLVDACIQLLSVYSGQPERDMYRAYLAAFIEADRRMTPPPTSAGEAPADCAAAPVSSLIAPWTPSDPRRMILLHVLQQLRVSASTGATASGACAAGPAWTIRPNALGKQTHPEARPEAHLEARPDAGEEQEPAGASHRASSGSPSLSPCAGTESRSLRRERASAHARDAADTRGGRVGEVLSHWGYGGGELELEPPQSDAAKPLTTAPSEEWLRGLFAILERQARPEDVAPAVRVDVFAIVFELFANAEIATRCSLKYSSFVVDAIIQPNLRWRPGEAHAKLRNAALASLSAVLATLTAATQAPAGCEPDSPRACEDASGHPRVSAEKLEDAQTECRRLRETAGLPELLERLLPCLLSCLDDDGQPDTRMLTANILARLFSQMQRAVLKDRALCAGASSPSAASRGESPHSAGTARSDAARSTSSTRSRAGGATKKGERGGSGDATGEDPRSAQDYMSLCASLYAPLLQRLDDARNCVRLAAARALGEMLGLLLALKDQWRGTPSPQAPADGQEKAEALELGKEREPCTPREGEGLASDSALRKESHAVEAGESRLDETPAARLQGGEDCQQQKEDDDDARSQKWRWSCLEFLVKGLVTFVDEKDEELAKSVIQALEIAGRLEPALLLRESKATIGQSLCRGRYEALAEFAARLLKQDTVSRRRHCDA
ncbi:hypothetical protein BESB_022640 [Besnoitia besnoiti]|uniref:HEAT repeat-containing protein n=1 Tax=Besnoitia besnoiti TaxID=94643 RepID=A0A2A9M8P9_BESBE|nr:hypothetical protein BESB_022640 [Besnoitia besnoiti]PFH31772.1 hypothetical protein BESB_022640 [Besnoitia besnoiti]